MDLSTLFNTTEVDVSGYCPPQADFPLTIWGFVSHSKQPSSHKIASNPAPSLHPTSAAWMCMCAGLGTDPYRLYWCPAARGALGSAFLACSQVVSTLEWRVNPPCRDICLWAQKHWNPRGLSNPAQLPASGVLISHSHIQSPNFLITISIISISKDLFINEKKRCSCQPRPWITCSTLSPVPHAPLLGKSTPCIGLTLGSCLDYDKGVNLSSFMTSCKFTPLTMWISPGWMVRSWRSVDPGHGGQ